MEELIGASISWSPNGYLLLLDLNIGLQQFFLQLFTANKGMKVMMGCSGLLVSWNPSRSGGVKG